MSLDADFCISPEHLAKKLVLRLMCLGGNSYLIIFFFFVFFLSQVFPRLIHFNARSKTLNGDRLQEYNANMSFFICHSLQPVNCGPRVFRRKFSELFSVCSATVSVRSGCDVASPPGGRGAVKDTYWSPLLRFSRRDPRIISCNVNFQGSLLSVLVPVLNNVF